MSLSIAIGEGAVKAHGAEGYQAPQVDRAEHSCRGNRQGERWDVVACVSHQLGARLGGAFGMCHYFTTFDYHCFGLCQVTLGSGNRSKVIRFGALC